MQNKGKELELSPAGRLLKNAECEFVVTKGDVGETLVYLPTRSALVIMEEYARDKVRDANELLKRVARLDEDPFKIVDEVKAYLKKNKLS
jgi:hypothetical protein